MRQDNDLVVCQGLTKRFGRQTALDRLDLNLPRGKFIGLLGPNGSGKTTMIKLINGLLTPTEGTVLVDGQAPGTYTHSIISYLPDRPYLSDWMRVSDLLAFFSDFYKDFDQVKADEMLKDLKIGPGQRLKVLSKGTKEKVQLILTMSRKAQLYVLDEPIAGVDPAARDYILGTILSNYSEEASVLLSTHLIADIERVLDEVVFIRHGPAQGRGRHSGGDGQVGGYSVPGGVRMLSKLIRYEWKAVARVCIPMYGGLILAAMLTHFLLGNLERFSSTLYDIITMAMSTLCFGLFMAAFVLTLIIQIQRFSKNLLGDEGYLMFTLPASVSQHITAKLVVAVLLDVLSVAAAILAVLALALDGTMWLDLPGDFFDMIVYVDWSDWLLLLEVLILCLAAGAVGMLHIYASIAVGHLARKHRTLAAFGAYFGFAVALNILFTGMLEIFVSSPWMAEIGRWFMELKGDTGGHLLMWLLILGIAVLGAGFFVLTRYLLKNHLNLE